jgi:hypothetical protein
MSDKVALSITCRHLRVLGTRLPKNILTIDGFLTMTARSAL